MSVSNFHSNSVQCGTLNTQSLGLQSCAQFYPAVLKFCPNPSLGWHIEYYARSFKEQKLVRYRVRLNVIKRRYRKVSEFYEYANMMVAEVNASLSQGWIPDHDNQLPSQNDSVDAAIANAMPTSLMTMPSGYVPTASVPTSDHITSTHTYVAMINELQKEVSLLKDIVAKSSISPVENNVAKVMPTEPSQSVDVEFVPSVPSEKEADTPKNGIALVELLDRFVKAKETIVRKDTMRSYRNYAKLFKLYLEEYLPGIAAQDFSRSDAQAYLTYREEESMKSKTKRGDKSEVSTRTLNNYIKSHRLFFAWGIEEELITNNPFAQLKLQRNEEKRRDLVTDNALSKVKTYLTANDQKGFLLVCMLIYSGFIRPKEIRELRVRDIHMKDHCIIVPPEVSKNHCSRVVGLTPEIEELMCSLHLDIMPMDYYICGKGLIPSETPAPDALYSKAWVVMRKELQLPETMQLYSLKDTGITNMLENGVPAIDVMKQAGHHDLSMTSRYANHRDTRIAQKMYNNNLSFGSQKE